jgi:hypothetical protein
VLLVHYVTPLLHKHSDVIDRALEDGLLKGKASLLEIRARFGINGTARHAEADGLEVARD